MDASLGAHRPTFTPILVRIGVPAQRRRPFEPGIYQGLGNAKIVRFIPPTALPRSWVTSSSRGVHQARRRSTRTFRHFAETLHLVSVRHLPAADAATLLDAFGLTTPAAAPVVVVGGLALARSARRISNGGRRGPSWPSWRGRPAWSSADCGGRRRGWSRHPLSRHPLWDRRRLCGSHPRPDSGEAWGGMPCMASSARLSGLPV